MTTISHYPHDLNTKYYAVLLYRNGNPISFVCRRYKCSKASLMRWNKKFNGSKESLLDKSHRPLSPHPNAHTEEELYWIKNYIRRNPNVSLCWNLYCGESYVQCSLSCVRALGLKNLFIRAGQL